MKKKIIVLIIATVCTLSFSVKSETTCPIIPKPELYESSKGNFQITDKTIIVSPAEYTQIAELFSETISKPTGIKIPVKPISKTSGNIVLKINPTIVDMEGYQIKVTPSGIEVQASTGAGIIVGLQSLQQLIIFSKNNQVECCNIIDKPRFHWRGLMLDVSRTFMNVNLVKRYIDLMAFYKVNILHFHLTDDQGWRIEIKKYPLLTEIGSKFDTKFNSMGGYYTQVEIKELVRYAQLRNITIIPEIEIPGHSCAAIASYPMLSCRNERPPVHLNGRDPFGKSYGEGVHKEILCAGKASTYEFLYAVTDEVISLFPTQYIHIGGDEAPKERWKECPQCQAKIKEKGLKDEEELQSYMVKNIGEYLKKKNKVLIGWDEILVGGNLSGNEVIMYWRAKQRNIFRPEITNNVKAEINKGHKIVCTPNAYCYFDYDHKRLSTQSVYDYEPIMEGTNEKNYMGVQACFWSHIARGENRIDMQLFPRLLAISEVAWTKLQNKNWENFKQKVSFHSDYLKNQRNVTVQNNDSTLIGTSY